MKGAGMPLILRFAEGFYGERAGEGTGGGLRCVIEGDFDGVRIFLVLIDDEERPLAIRAMDGVGSDERVAGAISNVAFGVEEMVFAAARLHPLEIDELAGEELRERLLDL